eukprot:Opistho-2@97134
MLYSAKRQQFLVDQGYAFKVILRLPRIEEMPGLAFQTRREQIDLLATVVASKEEDLEEENVGNDGIEAPNSARGAVARRAGTMESLSGADKMVYMEYKTGARGGKGNIGISRRGRK